MHHDFCVSMSSRFGIDVPPDIPVRFDDMILAWGFFVLDDCGNPYIALQKPFRGKFAESRRYRNYYRSRTRYVCAHESGHYLHHVARTGRAVDRAEARRWLRRQGSFRSECIGEMVAEFAACAYFRSKNRRSYGRGEIFAKMDLLCSNMTSDEANRCLRLISYADSQQIMQSSFLAGIVKNYLFF